MNKEILIHIIRFFVLILTQVLVFNHINFLGYLNPYIYIIFIILAPITVSQNLFLLLSFILGLTIDMFGDSGGIHASACLIIAFIRPIILRFTFGLSYEFQTVKLSKVGFVERLIYMSSMVLIHHLLLFSLESFNISHIFLILKKTLFSSIFTIVITSLILALFRRKDS